MKKKLTAILFCVICATTITNGQIYGKLNGLYALVGVINPSVEFVVSPHSTVQGELVYSPWKSVKIDGAHRPLEFGILMGEYRYFLKEANQGWYFAGNLGFSIFNVSKPEIRDGSIRFQNRYCKGSGYIIGIAAGYEYQFAQKWILDAYFGWSFMHSYYNGYSLDGEIDMYPHRPVQPKYPDPYNKSAEWYPNKIGVSIGYKLFDPVSKKNKASR